MRRLFACLMVLLVSAAVPVNAADHFPDVFHTGLITIHSDQGLRLHAVNTRGARRAICNVEIAVFDSTGRPVTMVSFDLVESTAQTVPVRGVSAAVELLWARGMITPNDACNVVFTGEVFDSDGKTSNFLDFKPCFNPQPEPPGLGC